MTNIAQPNELRDELASHLRATGLGEQPGTLLYSGLSTLQPGPLYFLGYNPGGDAATEGESISSRFQKRGDEINEYLDTSWAPAGRTQAPGRALLQRRVCHFMEGLGLSTRSVCASNVIFVRSRAVASLTEGEGLAAKCWPVHLRLLSIVQPRLVFVVGNDAYGFVRSRSDVSMPETTFPSGHGSWQCRATTIRLSGRKMFLASAPHFGRYAIDRHPEVMRWISEKYLKGEAE